MWRVDETYIKVKGRWWYLYRAIDSAGATIDFLLSAFRDADAAKQLFRKALSDQSHPQPRVINTDLAPIYTAAIPTERQVQSSRKRPKHGGNFRCAIECQPDRLAFRARTPIKSIGCENVHSRTLH